MDFQDIPSTEAEFRRLVSRGESASLEFKTRLPPDQVISKSLVAMANSQGGLLLVGVNDKGEPIGLTGDEADRTLSRLRAITSSMFPQPTAIDVLNLKGKYVVVAAIDPVSDAQRPVATASGEVYVRQGSIDAPLPAKAPPSIRPSADDRTLTAFVAMSFREEELPALVDYYHAMDRAIERSGLPIQRPPKRIDLVAGDYDIPERIMAEINDADLVIVDLTLNSANVYFELGYARGQQKRIIQTCHKDTSLEFDIRNVRTAFYRNATDLEEKLIPELHSAYQDLQ